MEIPLGVLGMAISPCGTAIVITVCRLPQLHDISPSTNGSGDWS
jgi:hypothetical protein